MDYRRLRRVIACSPLAAALVASQLWPLSSASAIDRDRSVSESVKKYRELKSSGFNDAFSQAMRQLTPLALKAQPVEMKPQLVSFAKRGEDGVWSHSSHKVNVFLLAVEETGGGFKKELYLDRQGRTFIRENKDWPIQAASALDVALCRFSGLARTDDPSEWRTLSSVLATINERSGKTVVGDRLMKNLTAARNAAQHAWRLGDAVSKLQSRAGGTLATLNPVFEASGLKPIDANQASIARLWNLVKVQDNAGTVPLVVSPRLVTIKEIETTAGDHRRYEDYEQPHRATLVLRNDGLAVVNLDGPSGEPLPGRRFGVDGAKIRQHFPVAQVRRALVEQLGIIEPAIAPPAATPR